MKMQVCGFEINEGISKKSGKPYAIGRLHALIPMSGAEGAKGYIGHTYDAEVSVLDKIKHLAPPFTADIETQQVSRYGQPVTQVVSLVPVSGTKPAVQ